MDLLQLLIVWLIIGAIVGYIARLLVPGPDPMGCLGTSVLGIAGSFVGGTLGALIFGGRFQIRNTPSLIGSVLGAILILLFRRRTYGRRMYRR